MLQTNAERTVQKKKVKNLYYFLRYFKVYTHKKYMKKKVLALKRVSNGVIDFLGLLMVINND